MLSSEIPLLESEVRHKKHMCASIHQHFMSNILLLTATDVGLAIVCVPVIWLSMAIRDAMGGILSFWLQIQNLCKNLVQMIYRSSWFGAEVQFPPKYALKHRYGLHEMPQMKYWFSDFRFRIPVKIRSRWYIDQHDWWRSNFPQMRPKHTDMTIYDVTGGILNFQLQIQNICENLVQMIYRSTWLWGPISPKIGAKTHRYDYIRCHRWNFKFLTSDSESLWKSGPDDI